MLFGWQHDELRRRQSTRSYSFGLYSYVYSDPSGQQFEVLDYWVNQVANNAP
ncbi:MAG: hypothetical protein OEM15_04400 [Myxococcales bacterium]|nr:hypothetical protein [Myxococcales bacterium]MDH3484077.1 hypothetical protein [Myxococcales bacterium]